MKRTSLALLLTMVGCADGRLKPCDITARACQEDIYYTDLRVRGDGYDPFGGIPPIQTKTEAQYRQELEAAAAQSEPDATIPVWWQATLAMLGLTPASQNTVATSIDDQVSNTGAFYSWETRDITIIQHPDQSSDWQGQVSNMSTLAHELVHALQDRELDLRKSSPGTDESLAYGAMIEGDAMLYENLFDDQVSLPDGYHRKYAGDPVSYFGQWREDYFSKEFSNLGAPFFAARWMVYPLGGLWQATLWKEGGNAAVRHGYATSPTRMLDFMAGNGAGLPSSVPIACAPTIQDDFKHDGGPYGVDQFGAAELYAYLFASGLANETARARALSWRNDRLFVYFNETTQKTAAAWRIELSEPLAPETLAALAAASDRAHVLQQDATLLVTASDDPVFLAGWAPGLSCP